MSLSLIMIWETWILFEWAVPCNHQGLYSLKVKKSFSNTHRSKVEFADLCVSENAKCGHAHAWLDPGVCVSSLSLSLCYFSLCWHKPRGGLLDHMVILFWMFCRTRTCLSLKLISWKNKINFLAKSFQEIFHVENVSENGKHVFKGLEILKQERQKSQ